MTEKLTSKFKEILGFEVYLIIILLVLGCLTFLFIGPEYRPAMCYEMNVTGCDTFNKMEYGELLIYNLKALGFALLILYFVINMVFWSYYIGK